MKKCDIDEKIIKNKSKMIKLLRYAVSALLQKLMNNINKNRFFNLARNLSLDEKKITSIMYNTVEIGAQSI